MEKKFIFIRASEDSYFVKISGEIIGEVFKGWAREGGSGWTHSAVFTPQTWKTRNDAAVDLFKRWKKSN